MTFGTELGEGDMAVSMRMLSIASYIRMVGSRWLELLGDD